MWSHVNGHKEDAGPENLMWTCRSCNVRCGNVLRAVGLGRLNRQYNPASDGAQSLGAMAHRYRCDERQARR
jgi:hypothetical protein